MMYGIGDTGLPGGLVFTLKAHLSYHPQPTILPPSPTPTHHLLMPDLLHRCPRDAHATRAPPRFRMRLLRRWHEWLDRRQQGHHSRLIRFWELGRGGSRRLAGQRLMSIMIPRPFLQQKLRF